VQVAPIKSKLKPPGTKGLKLKCDKLLLNFAFKFNLRRYILVVIDEFNGQIDALENLTAHVDLTSQISSGSFTYGGNRQGMMDGARHVIGCHLTPEPRVQNAFDDVASTIHQFLGSNALS